jgi:hypothetical protein
MRPHTLRSPALALTIVSTLATPSNCNVAYALAAHGDRRSIVSDHREGRAYRAAAIMPSVAFLPSAWLASPHDCDPGVRTSREFSPRLTP